MKDLFKHVRELNRREQLWSCGDTLILGVSGGPDSMCLLDLMVRCAHKDDLTLIVAHVNYGLRAEDSDADEELVRKVSRKHNLVYDVKHIQPNNRTGSEALWREQRRAHFNAVKEQYGAQTIFLGHTANDQAETILLHLLRGAGLNGLRGMQYSKQNVIRPLLRIQKKEILAYCKQRHISYGADVTNHDLAFTRNRIRHKLLPLLAQEYNPEIITILQRAADHIATDYDFLDDAATRCIPAEIAKESVTFSARAYQNCHRALQHGRLHQFVSILQKEQVDITASNIDELHKVLVSEKNKHHVVRLKGLKMERKGDTVKLTTEV